MCQNRSEIKIGPPRGYKIFCTQFQLLGMKCVQSLNLAGNRSHDNLSARSLQSDQLVLVPISNLFLRLIHSHYQINNLNLNLMVRYDQPALVPISNLFYRQIHRPNQIHNLKDHCIRAIRVNPQLKQFPVEDETWLANGNSQEFYAKVYDLVYTQVSFYCI